jgi:hypothetical protein
MNIKLLAASALFFQSGALLVIYQLFSKSLMLSQPKYAVQQQAAKLFHQYWRHLKLKEIMTSILLLKCQQINRTKAYRQSIVLQKAANKIKPAAVRINREKDIFCVLRSLGQLKNSK